jgi:hypothetical protein
VICVRLKFEQLSQNNELHYVRFEVFSAVTMKNVIFLDVTSCGSCKRRHFGGTYRLHLQSENNQRTRNSLSVVSKCSTLRRIHSYIRKEVIEWDILHGGHDYFYHEDEGDKFLRNFGSYRNHTASHHEETTLFAINRYYCE